MFTSCVRFFASVESEIRGLRCSNHIIQHLGIANEEPGLTRDGIDVCGERLVGEVREPLLEETRGAA
jgi:hypothetical protein